MALVHDSISDFVLFPRDQSYMDMLDSRADDNFENLHFNAVSNMPHQFSDLPHATYDSYSSTSTFSTSNSSFYDTPNFLFEIPKESERLDQRYTPSGTPSPSASHTLDHPPSVLSSASGASAQSTASSAAGSPYSHATSNIPGQEHWTESHQGLGIVPGIVHNEGYGHEIFPITRIESDPGFDSDKFPNGFVGESKILSSSASMDRSISSLLSSRSAPQNFSPTFSSPPLVLDTSIVGQNVTIDTILSEVNCKIGTPSQMMSPGSGDSFQASPDSLKSIRVAHSPQHTKGFFKSPVTPASAKSPFTPRTHSPFSSRHHDSRRDSTSPSPNRFHPYGRPAPTPNSQAQFHRHESQSPFFSQSSGRFIPPLESSCRFSSTTPLCFLLFHCFFLVLSLFSYSLTLLFHAKLNLTCKVFYLLRSSLIE